MAEPSLRAFPPVSYREWRALVESELEGAAFTKLCARTADGLLVDPLYAMDEPGPLPAPAAPPGLAPFTRHASACGTRAGWEIRHEVRGPSVDDAVREVDLAARHGATALALVVARASEARGVALRDDDLTRVLDAIEARAVSLALDAGSRGVELAERLARLGRVANARVGLDPLGALAMEGALPYTLDDAWMRVAAFTGAPGALAIHAWHYAEAGAPPAEQLGLALAHALEMLRGLERAGVAPERAAAALEVRLAIGRDLFTEIAALRASRLVFAQMLALCGVPEPTRRVRLHVRGLLATKTARDPWVNILRGSIDTFVAAVGGAESVTTVPFDAVLGVPDELGVRLATHTPVIAREEAHLDRVVDPAGGSWYIERLTLAIAERAWAVMQEVEREGGFLAALRAGRLASRVAALAAARARSFATLREPITGVTSYPNAREDAPVRAAHAPPPAILSDRERAPALVPVRFAAGFEALRDQVEAHRTRTGRDATAFLATMGPPAQHRARAGFTRGFVAIAGLACVGGESYATPDDAARAFASSGAAAAVICSTDETYPEIVPPLAAALRRAGARAIVVAGRPGDHEGAWREAGVDLFIHLGCDAETILRELVARMEVHS